MDLPPAIPCLYFGPAPNHPRDTYQVMKADTRKVIITRDVTSKTLGAANNSSGQTKVECPVLMPLAEVPQQLKLQC